MMTWWFTTFMAPAIKQKVHNLPGVEYLYEVMPPDQLEIPAYITEYDMTVRKIKSERIRAKSGRSQSVSLENCFLISDKRPEVLSAGSCLVVPVDVHVTRRWKSLREQRSVKMEVGPCVPRNPDCNSYSHISDIRVPLLERKSRARGRRRVPPMFRHGDAKNATLPERDDPRDDMRQNDSPAPRYPEDVSSKCLVRNSALFFTWEGQKRKKREDNRPRVRRDLRINNI